MDSLEFYRSFHTNPINKFIHGICIPLIILTIINILAGIDKYELICHMQQPFKLKVVQIYRYYHILVLYLIIYLTNYGIKITLDWQTTVDILRRDITPQQAFQRGRLKFTGPFNDVLKVNQIVETAAATIMGTYTPPVEITGNLHITVDNQSWYLATSQISFTFAVGLFLVVSISTLVKEAEKGVQNIQKFIIQEITSSEIKSLTELFNSKIFKELFMTYGRVSSIRINSRFIFILMITYLIIGSIILNQMTNSISSSEGIITSDQLLPLLFMVIIITVGVIYGIYESSVKMEKNLRIIDK